MAHVPTEADIDAMSEEELEAFLNRASAGSSGDEGLESEPPQDTSGVPAWLTPTGAPRSYAWTLIAGSSLGIGASWELMDAELQQLREPMGQLTCDINPLVSCGASLNVWQGNLLGVPNAFLGAMAFAVLLAFGVLLLSGVRLPRWIWWGLCAGSLGGLAFVAWFLGVSVLTFGKLCPWCMSIWAATIPIATATWGQAAAAGHLGVSRARGRRLARRHWWVAIGLYAVIVVIILTAFWDQWMALVS
ncbi:vitamin K epoxide reductase family protein [Actinomyces oricola]|uniref:vitamin K epoxide reductase family protein n=1 Tax=Actinomyces oricola TaxID=206043 RepID=UPI000FFF1B52|nr:vitamin K epoxide reductase family protein [Actinomyces oricola]